MYIKNFMHCGGWIDDQEILAYLVKNGYVIEKDRNIVGMNKDKTFYVRFGKVDASRDFNSVEEAVDFFM